MFSIIYTGQSFQGNQIISKDLLYKVGPWQIIAIES